MVKGFISKFIETLDGNRNKIYYSFYGKKSLSKTGDFLVLTILDDVYFFLVMNEIYGFSVINLSNKVVFLFHGKGAMKVFPTE